MNAAAARLAGNPTDPDAIHGAAQALAAAGRADAAAALLQAGIALMGARPGDTAARAVALNDLANALWAADWPDAALAAHRRALALAPDSPGLHATVARALSDAFRPAEALPYLRRAVALRPDIADARYVLGGLEHQLGHLDAAAAAYRATLARAPGFAGAWLQLMDLAVDGPATDADVAAMTARLAAPGVEDGERIVLRFALARAFETRGDVDAMFRHLEQGHRLRQARRVTAPGALAAALERRVATVDGSRLARLDGFGDPTSLPVFIVGMPRSGTTLVERILAGHSRVTAGGELTLLDEAVATAGDLTDADGAAVAEVAARYRAGLTRRAFGAARVTDKMPLNFRHLAWIRLALPRAVVIHCRRDARDTCLSCHTKLFTAGDLDFTGDLAELGRTWRAYDRLMAHWQRLMPGWILDVSYETLVDDPDTQARRLVAHCGLDWEDGCLAIAGAGAGAGAGTKTENGRAVATASAAQVRRPIHRGAVGRWRRCAAWLGPLLAALEA